MSMTVVAVRCADPSDMSAFGVRVTRPVAEPRFRVSDGIVWKAAGWIVVYDNGRMFVQAYNHLTAHELRIMYGLIEAAFTGGQAKCRREGWERCRKSKSRAVAFYREHYYVRADTADPHAQMVMAASGLDDQDVDKVEALGIDREAAV